MSIRDVRQALDATAQGVTVSRPTADEEVEIIVKAGKAQVIITAGKNQVAVRTEKLDAGDKTVRAPDKQVEEAHASLMVLSQINEA